MADCMPSQRSSVFGSREPAPARKSLAPGTFRRPKSPTCRSQCDRAFLILWLLLCCTSFGHDSGAVLSFHLHPLEKFGCSCLQDRAACLTTKARIFDSVSTGTRVRKAACRYVSVAQIPKHLVTKAHFLKVFSLIPLCFQAPRVSN